MNVVTNKRGKRGKRGMSASDEVPLIVQRCGDGVDDLERIDSLGSRLRKPTITQPPSRSCARGAANRSRLSAEGPCQLDIPRSEQAGGG